MNDFRNVVDFFLWYREEPEKETMTKGVRTNCNGDMRLLSKPAFEAVEAPSSVFPGTMTSSIAYQVVLPLFTRRCTTSKESAKDSEAYTNPKANLLHLNCDPEIKEGCAVHTAGFGEVALPAEWKGEVGSITVVRADLKPLLPLHVEALCRYCEGEIQPLMARASGKYDERSRLYVSKQSVHSMVSLGDFELFWHDFVEEKCKKEELDAAVPSPYEIEDKCQEE